MRLSSPVTMSSRDFLLVIDIINKLSNVALCDLMMLSNQVFYLTMVHRHNMILNGDALPSSEESGQYIVSW